MGNIFDKQNPTRVVELELADDANPLFRIKWVDEGQDAENPDVYAKITVDHNSSDDTKLIILLNIGASSTDYTQYQFSAYATGIADPGGIDGSPTHTQVTTLGALITALNLLDGIYAKRLHAPADYSLDTDDFITAAAADLSPLFTEHLYRDADQILTISYRLGVPDNVKGGVGNGNIKIVRAIALIDSNSATDCDFKISYDPDEVDATKEQELAYSRKVPDNTITELFNYYENPAVHRGPLLIEATSTAAMAAGAKLWLHYQSDEL